MAERPKVAVVLGSDGRANALAQTIARNPDIRVLVFPGSDFITDPTKRIFSYQEIADTDAAAIVQKCLEEQSNGVEVLLDVSKDESVAAGIANAAREAHIPTFGPSKEAGQVEWDKTWSRELMQRAGVLQPEFHIFDNPTDGKQFLMDHPWKKWFIKASGLTAGKGAIPAKDPQQGHKAIDEVQKYGNKYLVEEWLEGDDGTPGEEFSAFAYCDGTIDLKTGKPHMQIVGYAQDHKRAYDGDEGPNTGGMGCISNPRIVDRNIKKQTQDYFERIFKQLYDEHRPYQGVLYFGGMVVKRDGQQKVYAIECNARWGDPEAEVLVPGITTDLFDLNMAVATGRLKDIKIRTDGKRRVSIAVVADGYPTTHGRAKGRRITGLAEAARMKGITIFGAGIKKDDDEFIIEGGRVVHVVAEGGSLPAVIRRAYRAAAKIKAFEGGKNWLRFRGDIGAKELQKLPTD